MLAMVNHGSGRSARPGRPPHRAGVALVIVLALVMLCGFFAALWFFLARGEKDRTQVHTHEIEATVIGEGAAARISTMVKEFAWSERFYVKLAQPGRPFLFTHRTYPFDMRHGLFATGDAGFAGTIYDHPTCPFSYRIVMEIVARGSTVVMTWDKVYPQTLLSAASDDGTFLSAHVDASSTERIDRLIDQIRDDARGNRGEGELTDRGLAGELDGRRSGRNPGRDLLGGSTGPSVPSTSGGTSGTTT
ncbi:MAG: hypothetical protein HY815_04540 [Candidatus Riflebacteria bacterium]|nr:hypothetical protein [Candidatus Riflebacteria bacterium]